MRRCHQAVKVARVGCRNHVAAFQLFREDPEFSQQNRCLNRVQPGIHSQTDIIIFVHTLSVYRDGAAQYCQFIVIRE